MSGPDPLKRARGDLYLAEARVERLTHAWADQEKDQAQLKAIEDAQRVLAVAQSKVARLERESGG